MIFGYYSYMFKYVCMKQLIVLSLLLFGVSPSFAQEQIIKDSSSVKDTVVIKGTISGKVTTEAGMPIMDAEVYVYNIDDIIASATTDSAGNYLTNRMVVGTYRVWVKSKGYTRKSIGGVQVKAWQDTKLDIKLSLFNPETGRVDAVQSDPVKIIAVPPDNK